MTKKIIMYFLFFISTSFFAEASDGSSNNPAKCIENSAEKFGVPPDVLRAIIISGTKYRIGINGDLEARPFNFHVANRKILSEKGGFDWKTINKDTCENYNAVAWYLMNVSGGNDQKDIWEAVKKFFFGPNYKKTFALSRNTSYNPYRAALKVHKELTDSNKIYHHKYDLWTVH